MLGRLLCWIGVHDLELTTRGRALQVVWGRCVRTGCSRRGWHVRHVERPGNPLDRGRRPW